MATVFNICRLCPKFSDTFVAHQEFLFTEVRFIIRALPVAGFVVWGIRDEQVQMELGVFSFSVKAAAGWKSSIKRGIVDVKRHDQLFGPIV